MTHWFVIAWRAMGPWRWIGVAAIIVVAMLTLDAVQAEGVDRDTSSSQHGHTLFMDRGAFAPIVFPLLTDL